MLEKYYFTPSDQTDLQVYRCGIEECKPEHTWGPGIRDHFIVHYILKGEGCFSDGKSTYPLKQGDGFIIFPGTLVTYTADKSNPWTYTWVGFHGLKAESLLMKAGISKTTPVFTEYFDERISACLYNMLSAARPDTSSELMLLGNLYIFLSLLISNSQNYLSQTKQSLNKENYVRRVVDYISKNYSRKISIGEMARMLGLDRSYLYSLFKQYLSISIQDFIIHYRLERATELMQNSSLSIGDISRSVGYPDPLQFSKIFKKVKGSSPRDFRFNQVEASLSCKALITPLKKGG